MFAWWLRLNDREHSQSIWETPLPWRLTQQQATITYGIHGKSSSDFTTTLTHEEKLCKGEPNPGQQRMLLKGDALYKIRAAAPKSPTWAFFTTIYHI